MIYILALPMAIAVCATIAAIGKVFIEIGQDAHKSYLKKQERNTRLDDFLNSHDRIKN